MCAQDKGLVELTGNAQPESLGRAHGLVVSRTSWASDTWYLRMYARRYARTLDSGLVLEVYRFFQSYMRIKLFYFSLG